MHADASLSGCPIQLDIGTYSAAVELMFVNIDGHCRHSKFLARCFQGKPVFALQTTFANVVCRDATRVPYPSHHKATDIQGYALKAFALYATSFTEVILLDADNLPVLDPSLLFTTPEYTLYGSMFWYVLLHLYLVFRTQKCHLHAVK